jgi:hypothetical protein
MPLKKHSPRCLFVILAAFACVHGYPTFSRADEPSKKDLAPIVDKGIDYLRLKGQAEDGSFTKHAGPGVTSLVATAALRNGRMPRDPVVAKSLKYLKTFVQPDGGIYAPQQPRSKL